MQTVDQTASDPMVERFERELAEVLNDQYIDLFAVERFEQEADVGRMAFACGIGEHSGFEGFAILFRELLFPEQGGVNNHPEPLLVEITGQCA